jgi:S1-C subfamily serine protease
MVTGFDDWSTAEAARPRPDDFAFDLDWALSSVVGLRARVADDAFTAASLGVERVGHGVLIRQDGVVLTVGYLITEAEQISLTTAEGRTVPGRVLGYDQASGLGLVRALEPLGLPVMPLCDAPHAPVGERVVMAGVGGRKGAIAARIVARQAFAGQWEYLLEEAIFTAPAHPFWSGAALVGPTGKLLGVGSLQLQRQATDGRFELLNMTVPIDLLGPVFDDLLTGGRDLPARPWLGVFAQDIDDQVVIAGCAGDGPARRAGLEKGDIVLAVDGHPVGDLADFYRSLWALGDAGVDAPLRLSREGDVFDVRVTSRDRRRFLKMRRTW